MIIGTTAVHFLFQIETGSLKIVLDSLAGVLIAWHGLFLPHLLHQIGLYISQLLLRPSEEFQLFVLKRLKIFWSVITEKGIASQFSNWLPPRCLWRNLKTFLSFRQTHKEDSPIWCRTELENILCVIISEEAGGPLRNW